MLILITSALQMRMDKGGLTHRTTINHTTRGKPLRLQKLSFLNPPPLYGQELLKNVLQTKLSYKNSLFSIVFI